MLKSNPIAIIREAECIGCTKCIQACPVDAILGANKYMHTVIASECIGCQLFIPPSPVDGIDLITQPATQSREERKQLTLRRITARKQRLANNESTNELKQSFMEKKNYLKNAVARAQAKKKLS